MSTDKKLVVIARYNEDISWINSLKSDLVIYNKGTDFPWDIPRCDIANFGREAETYVTAILNFYDRLKEYDRVIFLQGSPFEHSKSILKKIEINHEEPYKRLGDNYQSFYSGVEECVYESSYFIVELFLKEIVKYTTIQKEKDNFAFENLSEIKYELTERDGSKLNRPGELIEIICLCEMLRIPYKSARYDWDCGAQYSVKTEYILNKSYSWWKSLYNLIHHSSQTLNLNILPYMLERGWPLIWNHDERRAAKGHFISEGHTND